MIVEKVKELAKQQGLSVYQVEACLGFGHNTIYQWNHRQPSIYRVQKVADFFGVSVDYLLGRSTEPKQRVDLTENEDVIFTYQGKKLSEKQLGLIKTILRNNN
jgi:transcriptional regulator with XRE-family HTH domain